MTLIVKKDGIYNQQGEKQKLQFGNIEQISAIRKAEKELIKHTEGFELSIYYETQITASVSFKCVCQTNLNISHDVPSEEEIEEFDETEKRCHKCGRIYELNIDKGDSLTCKLKKIA
jgi:hypothetical protein